LLPKPTNLTHLQAAAIPYGGFLAWHVITKQGNLQPGQNVLIYGASGSIGTMAIQLSKIIGAAKVTAACSSKNFDLVQSLGADDVIDYTSGNAIKKLFSEEEGGSSWSFHLVVDAVGNSKTSALKNAAKSKARATPGCRYVSIDDDIPSTKPNDFIKLKELAEQGKLVPIIDRCFPLEEMAQAHAYVDKGHKKGNVVISVTDEANEM